MERLILDTGVLIAAERGRGVSTDVLPDDADIAIAAITASELLVGVELADGQRRATRRATVDAILQTFEVLVFDLHTAHHHAALLAYARSSGRQLGAHDLQVAATARATSRVLVTRDQAAFADLPGVQRRIAA